MQQKKAIIYARQSSGKEENSESISFQIDKCRELALRHNLEVIGEYHDANTSGRLYPDGCEDYLALDDALREWCSKNTLEKKSRPGLRKALDRLPQADCLIVYDMTRLYRPLLRSLLQNCVDNILVRSGAEIMTVKEGTVRLSDFSDSLVSTIKSQVNDNQIRLTNEKSRMAMRRLKDSGFLPTGPRMYGIRYLGGEERRVEVDPQRAEVIRFVFENTLKLKPYNWIVREMNRLYGDRTDGKGFYITSFRHIIAQPFYCGYMYDSHGALIPARQMEGQEIVTFDTWRKANEIVNSKQRPVRHRKSQSHPFSGILCCGYCGARMLTGQDGDKEFYHCITALDTGRKECRQSRVVINLIRKSDFYTGLRKAVCPLLALALFHSLEKQDAMLRRGKSLDRLKVRGMNLEKRLADAAEAYGNGTLALNSFAMVQEKLNGHIRKNRDEVAELESVAENAAENERRIRSFLENIDDLMEDRLEDHVFESLLRESVSKISCFHDHLDFETVYGNFTLNRYMDGKFRNFPRFTYEIVPPDGFRKDPRKTQIYVTYKYGKGADKKLIVDLECMKIFAI